MNLILHTQYINDQGRIFNVYYLLISIKSNEDHAIKYTYMNLFPSI